MLSLNSLVLVCLLPTHRDLEIARLLGWYRIPFKSAPKVVAVDYLAFYQPGRFNRPERHASPGAERSGGPGGTEPPGQTGNFGDQGAQIQYVAEVKGHELTTRLELLRDEPDHPRAHEEYYKIQTGGLEKLPQPVKAEKWRRITFLYTTGEYLLNAKTLNDLVVHSEERQLLWRSLRERAVGGQSYQADLPELDVDPQVLIALLGIKEIQSEYESDSSVNEDY
jgi:hypothetical protein